MREWRDVTTAVFNEQILPLNQPAVLRGLVGHWPAVRAGVESPRAIVDYLARLDNGSSASTAHGDPKIGGRFFYDAAMTGFNFERRKTPLVDSLHELLRIVDDELPPSIYIQALPVAESMPDFPRENALGILPESIGARIWVGNRVTVQTHYDLTSNIACVVAGRRRFTLFPPEQVANLYVGPLEFTLAGTPVSMVQLDAPDFERYPRFRDALAHAQVGELEPGDAIFIPYMWWHHVETLSGFNVLVNYWWAETPRWMGSPFEALVHALLAVRSLPPQHREIWRTWFDHYIFETPENSAAHLPPHSRGVLSAPTAETAAMMRGYLLAELSRADRNSR
jgi:hypothetical protein